MFQKIRSAFARIAGLTKRRERIEETLEELKWTLVENDVVVDVAESLVDYVRERIELEKQKSESAITEIIKEYMYRLLKPLEIEQLEKQIEQRGKPYVVLFLGINGTGKTTTIAKIAHRLKNSGFKPLLAAADTYRAGAIEQLEQHAAKLGVDIVAQNYGADPAAVARDAIEKAEARKHDVVLIDTAGRMYTRRSLMDELKKITRVVEPNEKMIVIDALAGNDAIEQLREFNEKIGVDTVAVTKVDADVKGGIILSIAHEVPKPIRYLGVGQRYADLIEFKADWVIDNLLPRA